MEHNISILFYRKMSKKVKGNLVPVYMRITINGERIEQTTKRYVQLSQWSSAARKMKGTHAKARVLNTYPDTLRNKVHVMEREMIQDGLEITYQSFKEKWCGVDKKTRMLLEVFKQHNDEVAQLAGKDFAATTLKRYTTSLRHTRNYIAWKYKVPDIDIRKLNYEFISNYAFWLKSIRNCNHNSSMKYLTNFKKIVLICLKNGWINKDPFIGFKLAKHEVERPFLTDLELQQIALKTFSGNRLNYVKDIFLFSCYTEARKNEINAVRFFGDFDNTTSPHKNILRSIEQGKGTNAFAFVEKIKILKELSKI